MLEKTPFQSYKDEEERDKEKGKVFTIRLNAEELANLRNNMEILQQPKVGTAVKQIYTYGAYVLHDRSTTHILRVMNDNLRKNKRIGIEKVEVKG